MDKKEDRSQSQELKDRTKRFALRVVALFPTLPRSPEAQIIGKQVLRSATSVAANYRAARRARSRAEFVSKIGLVVEESDETLFWLEMLVDSGILAPDQVHDLVDEAEQLLAIFAATQRTARANRSRPNRSSDP